MVGRGIHGNVGVWIYGRNDNRDRNVRNIHPVVSGDDLVHDTAGDEEQEEPTAEEITSVLYVLRMGSSHYEREIIDYLIDRIDERRVNDE